MSSSEDAPELKAGHPPAVKVGGMRVVQNKPSHPEKVAEPVKEEPTEEGQGEDETSTEVDKKTKDKLLVSGALAKGNADFPAEAVKAYHEKPVPTKQPVNHIPHNNIQHVNQPRKNNY